MLKKRGFRQILVDGAAGIGLGIFVGLMLSLWVLFINERSEGGVEDRYGVAIYMICASYLVGGAFAGLVGGLLRPYLASIWGQALLCFLAALSFYTAASVSMPGDIFGSPVLDGLLIALFATPAWLLVVRVSKRTQRDLHRAAGADPPPPRVPTLRSEPEYDLWRDTPDGRELRLGSFVSRRAAEAKLESLSHLPHRYWIVQRDVASGIPSGSSAALDKNVSV